MTRFILPVLVLLLAAGPADAASKRAVTAKVTACETGLAPAGRYMVVEGRMRTASGAAALRMRFDLEVRTPARPRWVAVKAPSLGVWTAADPAPRRWQYAKRVENLAAPADYRMVVRFKWVDRDGRRLASAKRRSKRCEQPELRPQLAPLGVTIAAAGDPGVRRYIVRVRNSGLTAAAAFSISLAVGGQTLQARIPDGLAPDQVAEVEISGPRCEPSSPIAVVADADGAIDEGDEDDNELIRGCP